MTCAEANLYRLLHACECQNGHFMRISVVTGEGKFESVILIRE